MGNPHVDAVLAAADRMLNLHSPAGPAADPTSCIHCHRIEPRPGKLLCQPCVDWFDCKVDVDPKYSKVHAVAEVEVVEPDDVEEYAAMWGWTWGAW